MLYSTHAEKENVRCFQNMLFARLYSLPYLMKLNHLGQKSGNPPIFLPLSHHPFHIHHKILHIFLLNISEICPLFSILTVHSYISFSLGPLESLLSLHPAFFLSLILSTLYILARRIASDVECDHFIPFWVYWLYDPVLPDSVFIPVSPPCVQYVYLLKFHWTHPISHTILLSLFVIPLPPLFHYYLLTLVYPSELCSYLSFIKPFMFSFFFLNSLTSPCSPKSRYAFIYHSIENPFHWELCESRVLSTYVFPWPTKGSPE